MLCWFLPSNNSNQPEIYTCPLSLERPSFSLPYPAPSCSHRVLDWALRVTRQLPPNSLFSVWYFICFSAVLAIRRTLSLLLCVHKSVLCVWVFLPHSHAHPHIVVQDCSCTTVAELSGYYQEPIALNLKIFAVWPITENLCWSLVYILTCSRRNLVWKSSGGYLIQFNTHCFIHNLHK